MEMTKGDIDLLIAKCSILHLFDIHFPLHPELDFFTERLKGCQPELHTLLDLRHSELHGTILPFIKTQRGWVKFLNKHGIHRDPNATYDDFTPRVKGKSLDTKIKWLNFHANPKLSPQEVLESGQAVRTVSSTGG